MSNSSGNFIASLLELILSLFKQKAPSPAPLQPAGLPDSADEPASMTMSKVMLIVYDPTMEDGQNSHRK
jgi:hypothetical protein